MDFSPYSNAPALLGNFNFAHIVRLIQKHAREYRLEGPLKLRVTRALPADKERFEYAAELLKRLGEAPRLH